MYTYKNIAFRTIEEKDLLVLKDLHNDQSTYLNLYNINFVNDHDQKKWWERLSTNNTDKRYVICKAGEPGIIIGRLRIQNINLLHNNCEVGLDILSEFRGKSYGKISYEMLLEFLFIHYNMNMVYLKVAGFNPDAKKLYEKVGFKKTGYLPLYYYRHGKYWDYIIMSITKGQYFKTFKPQE